VEEFRKDGFFFDGENANDQTNKQNGEKKWISDQSPVPGPIPFTENFGPFM